MHALRAAVQVFLRIGKLVGPAQFVGLVDTNCEILRDTLAADEIRLHRGVGTRSTAPA